MTRAALSLLGLLVITASLIWWLRAVQQGDPTYAPQLSSRTWPAGGPVVVIDDAHWNAHTASRGYAPFAKLLAADGYAVVEHGNAASPQSLNAARIIVIANALGFRGAVREVGEVAGVKLDALGTDAFSDAEADRIETWVQEGGSLLLAADNAAAGRAVRSLAERFGVTIYDGVVVDPEHSEPSAPSLLVFTRESKTLGEHPVIRGRSSADVVDRVVTFTGQALAGPPNATTLLMFSGTAYQSRGSGGPEDRTSVAGLAQALALTYGRGRVVVVGEASMLTSQVRSGGGSTERIGLAWPNADNERFARHLMAWLSHAVD